MDEKPKLVFLDGDTAIREVPLDAGEWSLGRSRSCTIQLEDSEVSSRHAIIIVKGDEVWLKDGQSKNGTHLNEKLIRGDVSLAPGDVVRIGNTRFRFEAPASAAAEFAAPAAPAAEPEGGETRFMPLPEEPGTRILSGEKIGAPVGHDDGTAALPENATRMLEASELKGLQASPKAAWDVKKLAAGVALCIAVLVGAVFLTQQGKESGAEQAVEMETIHDQDAGFEISIPEKWSRSGKAGASLVTFKHQDSAGAKAQVDVMKDTKPEYELTGMTVGFNDLMDEHRSRPEFALVGQKKIEINEAVVIFYVFSSQTGQGKGIFLLDGDRRIVIEGVSSRGDYAEFADLYSTILQSFKLYQPQKYFDFPAPDETVRRVNLANPEEAAQRAREHFQQGKDLLSRREVRLDNLYRSIREFETSLQYSSALTTRPAIYGEAASELKYALQLFNENVRRQRYEINRAFKQADWQSTYWEAQKLMQMVPEKTDPIYQEAGAWVKKMNKRTKR